MSMTGAQTAAFQAASGMPVGVSSGFWLALTMGVVTLWLVWMLISVYKGWASQNVTRDVAFGGFAKAVLIYAILTWLILH